MNDPLLFIDSVSENKNVTSNQEIFDSRNQYKNDKALYRLEDIKAMLAYNMKVLCEIKAGGKIYEGYISDVLDKSLIIMINKTPLTLSFRSIEYINILKI